MDKCLSETRKKITNQTNHKTIIIKFMVSEKCILFFSEVFVNSSKTKGSRKAFPYNFIKSVTCEEEPRKPKLKS